MPSVTWWAQRRIVSGIAWREPGTLSAVWWGVSPMQSAARSTPVHRAAPALADHRTAVDRAAADHRTAARPTAAVRRGVASSAERLARLAALSGAYSAAIDPRSVVG